MYWGTSEWPAEADRAAHRAAREHGLHAPQMEQPEYNLLHRDRVEVEYAPLYAEFGLGTTIWSPLASGLLTGKYNDGVPAGSRLATPGYEWLSEMLAGAEGQAKLAKVGRLAAVAAELGLAPAQLALAWCLKNPHVSTVILGATRPQQLHENLGALDALARLDDGAMQAIEQALR